MKRFFALFLSVLLCFLAVGCEKGSDNGKLKVIATNFPAYDFAREICGDNADIKLLIKPGNESHSFEPTARDIIDVKECDIFICTGSESETFVDSMLKDSKNKNRIVVKMMECVELIGSADSDHDGHFTADEHVWTSPVNAVKIAGAITDAAAALDGQNSQDYLQCFDEFSTALALLDGEFKSIVDSAERKTVVFADRFPAAYFTNEYGLNVISAFPGCGSHTEPDAKTVVELIEKVKAEKIPAVFYIELSSRKMCDTVVNETGVAPLLFHTCHNVSKDDFNSGVTYLSLMTQNAENLKIALN